MATEWSDDITICDLTDEPQLSDDLNEVNTRIQNAGPAGTPHVILNFAGVTYLNSSNLAQLLRLRHAVQEAERNLTLCAIADPVWSILLLTGLDKVFTFAPDKATAIAMNQVDD
ncbi:MAG: STAS domain-containing protein [Phycisphaerales bacterium]